MVGPFEAKDAEISVIKNTIIASEIELNLIKTTFPEIITSDEKMHKTLASVFKISNSSSPVLILGESGTGKELIAKSIHRLSQRKANRFVTINCSAIPEALLESELFGYEKGAFTGAEKKRVGHLGIANGGSLFLDEIGEMPLRLQAKLLRVLQENAYTPLGCSEQQKVDIRIIAATNKNLHLEVEQKLFRLDLYYRLNVLTVSLPPLKHRKKDILLLIQHFIKEFSEKNSLSEKITIHPEAIKAMIDYSWPGNIRELQNITQRLFILRDKEIINKEDLPQEILASPKTNNDSCISTRSFVIPEEGMDLNNFLANIEDKIILEALKITKNNKLKAAKLLKINRTTLVERIKKKKLTYLES